MNNKTYAEKLKDPRWQKKRLDIMQRDNFTCQICSDTKTSLQVHHKKYINGNNPWDCPNEDLITLCEFCHGLIKDFKKLDFDKLNGLAFHDEEFTIRVITFKKKATLVVVGQNGNFFPFFLTSEQETSIIELLQSK